jgi:hypothetical protein
MYPLNVSSQEAYGKHRNLEEIRQMERQNQILQARSYEYGDPINSKGEYDETQTKSGISKETLQPRRLGVTLLARVFLFFFPFLSR